MLKVLTDEKTIKRCQWYFIKSFRPFVDEKLKLTIGHMGASLKTTVLWSKSLGIWYYSRKLPGKRYLNCFGTGKDLAAGQAPITCEVNFPLQGLDRRTGGVLAEDTSGRIFVLHRGKIGGGKKGIGRCLFREHYRGAWIDLDEGPVITQVAVIGELKSPRLARQVAQFIHKVDRIKHKETGKTQLEISFLESEFLVDHIGSPLTVRRESLADHCDHGLIVQDLADSLRLAGLRPGNDPFRDILLTGEKGQITCVFEVLTGNSTEIIQAGAAKLLWNSISLTERPQLVLMLPEAPTPEEQNKLQKLGINTGTFHWQENKAVFTNIWSKP